jgi:hypothetical protein
MAVVDDIVNSPVVPGTERPVQKIEMIITSIGVNNAVPDSPDLISPENGLEDVMLTQSFLWDTVSSAVLYRFQLSTDSNFTTIEYDDIVGTTNYWVGGLELGFVKYYWRVQSNNGGNLSSFSEVRTFTTGIDVPVLISPQDSAINVPTNPTFEWSPVNGAISYTLQISTFGSFLNFVVNQSGITSTTYSVSGLEENKKLYWRVRGATANYEGMFSQVFRFTTGATSFVDKNSNLITYNLEQNYPNPFNPSTVISYQLPVSSEVTLKVFDVLGNEVATLVDEYKTAGTYEVEFITSFINHIPSSGVYFYQLRAGEYTAIKKMVLLK